MRLIFTTLPVRTTQTCIWMEPFINDSTKAKQVVTESGGADGFCSTICDLLNPPSRKGCGVAMSPPVAVTTPFVPRTNSNHQPNQFPASTQKIPFKLNTHLESVDPLAVGVEIVHEMHGVYLLFSLPLIIGHFAVRSKYRNLQQNKYDRAGCSAAPTGGQ